MQKRDRNGELIGTLRSQRCSGGFVVGHWCSPASAPAIKPHGHDTAHIVIVTAGPFLTEARGSDAGPIMIFNPAGTYHADRFERNGTFVGITLTREVDDCLRDLPLPKFPTRFVGAAAAATAGRLMRATHSDSSDMANEAIEGFCFELFGHLEPGQRSDPHPPRWLRLAAEYLCDHERYDGIAAVAHCVGVHPVHLTRSFRRHYHCTPGEYRRSHKISMAANLLVGRRQSVAEIAAECRFADQSHLVRSFRRHFGMSPQQFRNALM